MRIDDVALKSKELGYYTYFPQVRSACGRDMTLADGRKMLSFASCDYLGLSNHERMKESAIAAIREYGSNIGGPMIFSGFTEYHERLQNGFNELYAGRTSLMFTTSYQANFGVIPLAAERADLILLDQLSHVSIWDGVKLSGCPFRAYIHANVEMLEQLVRLNQDKRILIITDGVFSADGDVADLRKITRLKQIHPSLEIYIDDAHGVGMLGGSGQGACESAGVVSDIDYIVGTMSKAFGSSGGFVVFKDEAFAERVRFRCPTYNGSQSVSPGVASASCTALEINATEGVVRRHQLAELTRYTHEKIDSLGVDKLYSKTAVIPVIFKDPMEAARVNAELVGKGIMGSLFVPPFVPNHQSRIRLCLTYNHTIADVDYCVDALGKII
ncbi:aminotransferase class I/II-fold pyridoxal phosphate-dependent enzyme [Pseudomonas sp. 10S4]|uniref:aminotransferase class I/II-fold pyridoxal phosphate-dependent enzyme n=2 Tax=unclassified Pseudomonas TaxID=196821 RepID=UPI002AC8BBA4|nr:MULTISPECIES: pyridoxal phosphate-dependent aminotransferase family protein [unclassified Pseudomonas]MEB0225222.1 pyridoxal phosphate-dependent aminotransferase family protein [Pseudomonas sp. 5S1]MEB0298604.1 pyridoxal phosphate-dependent aminotransferase family protein [Pseudomonas sp. 10S4]WPX16986.1 pyridoxal phosphate-dependent aminotransferase family protein [Pseudomonas sp. 10S4]